MISIKSKIKCYTKNISRQAAAWERVNLELMKSGEEAGVVFLEKDRQAGAVWDRQVRFGIHGDGPALRVVRAEASGDVFHLVTTREDLPAELIGLICRQRWQIELFFKWINMILNCRHWLAESPQGVEIQIYCALIASLLLMLWTGQRPNSICSTVIALQNIASVAQLKRSIAADLSAVVTDCG